MALSKHFTIGSLGTAGPVTPPPTTPPNTSTTPSSHEAHHVVFCRSGEASRPAGETIQIRSWSEVLHVPARRGGRVEAAWSVFSTMWCGPN